jgi:hypothetical protein
MWWFLRGVNECTWIHFALQKFNVKFFRLIYKTCRNTTGVFGGTFVTGAPGENQQMQIGSLRVHGICHPLCCLRVHGICHPLCFIADRHLHKISGMYPNTEDIPIYITEARFLYLVQYCNILQTSCSHLVLSVL